MIIYIFAAKGAFWVGLGVKGYLLDRKRINFEKAKVHPRIDSDSSLKKGDHVEETEY